MSIETIKDIIRNNGDLLHIEKQVFIEYSITEPRKNGKMDTIPSISTSALCNVSCAMRSRQADCICSKCYARRQLQMMKTLREKMEVNTLFYTKYELTAADIPRINTSVFRFESFGELNNELQVKNYFLIARRNRHCFFVLWTKNYHLIESARKLYGLKKPKNLRIIASEYIIDHDITEHIWKRYKFIDKIFSVYSKEYAEQNQIEINCSGKCKNCMRCYDQENKERFIREMLK